MASANPPGPPAYTSGPFNADGTPFVDTTDGTPALYPAFSGTGLGLTPAVVNPIAVADTSGMPQQNATLIELRCITNLLMLQLGSVAPDLEQMRADEAWNTAIGTGTL